MALPGALDSGAMVNELETISLRDRRCMPKGRAGTGLLRSIPSREGVTPMYQAVGDEGETLTVRGSSWNIGFGWCMLPSDPRLRRGTGMPYPGFESPASAFTTSPNKGFRDESGEVGLRSTMD